MKNLADFLQRNEVVHGHGISCQVHRDFRNVHGPRKGRVGLAAIFFIVPVDIARRFIARVSLQLAARRDILLARGSKIFRGVVVAQKASLRECLLDSLSR